MSEEHLPPPPNNDFVIYCDAGCTANPGDLAVAAVVLSPAGDVLLEHARSAGYGTNNIGEYRALRHGVEMANLVGAARPLFVCDSALVVQQVNGWWAMAGDSPLHEEHRRVSSALMRFERWWLKHVPREKNRRADWLCSTLLGQKRALKKAPAVALVAAEGAGRPGWSGM